MWIDTHCHLDAPEFGPEHALALQARARARALGVDLCVIPAVARSGWVGVRTLAHQLGDAYALGIHPLFVPLAQDEDLVALDAELTAHRQDPRLVAVGEIGLDFFVPALCEPGMRDRQQFFYRAQLRLARQHGLPVILHVRRSVDLVLKHLRELPTGSGIAHAFNGSEQQARVFLDLGFKLGFGGAVTFEAARQLRHLASTLPLDALVLETDAPDIQPQWLYVTSSQRAAGQMQALNTPAELLQIAQVVSALRAMAPVDLARATCHNACTALPRLGALCTDPFSLDT